MADRRVTVFGGSGFLGRRIVLRLAADGAEVRIAVRRPERAASLTNRGRPGQITAARADVWDEATVAPALAGAGAVVNTVGHYVERGDASFEAIHGQGARHVAAAASAAGVTRLVHISGIGADPASDLPYVRARATGERLVRATFPRRPSCARASCSAPTTTSSTAWPASRACCRRCRCSAPATSSRAGLRRRRRRGRSQGARHAGGGRPAVRARRPRVYSYKALVQLVLEQTGRKAPAAAAAVLRPGTRSPP